MENRAEIKETYKEKMEAHIHELGVKLDELSARAEKAKAQGKIEYYKMVESLREKQNAAQKKWEEYKTSTGNVLLRYDALSDGFNERLQSDVLILPGRGKSVKNIGCGESV